MIDIKTNAGNPDFPDQFVSKEEKLEKEFGVKFARAMMDYGFLFRDFSVYGNSSYERLLRLTQGAKSVETQSSLLQYGETANGVMEGQGYSHIDPNVLNIFSKLVNIAIDKTMSSKYKAGFTPIDPTSVKEERFFKGEVTAFYETKHIYEQMGMDLQQAFPAIDVKNMPETIEEFEFDVDLNPKIKYAKEAEIAVRSIMSNMDYEAHRESMIRDWIAAGVGVIWEYEDSQGKPKTKRIRPDSLICSFSDDPYFKNSWFAGHVEWLTPHQLYSECSSEIPLDEFKENIASLYTSNGKTNPHNMSGVQSKPDAQDYIQVLRFEFLSPDTVNHVIRTDKRGNVKIDKKSHDYQIPESEKGKFDRKEKVLLKHVESNRYGGTYIVGTDYVYNYNIKPRGKKHSDQLMDNELGYVIVAPNMVNGRLVSIAAQAEEVLVVMNSAWSNIKHILAKGYDGILELDEDSLIAMSEYLKLKDPKDTINTILKEKIITRRNDSDMASGAVAAVVSRFGVDLAQYIETLMMCINLLRQMTGFNEHSDGSTPKTNTLNKVMSMAISNTEAALSHLRKADMFVYRKIVEKVLASLQSLARQKGGLRAAGLDLGDFWETSGNFPDIDYQMYIDLLPSQEQWQNFYQLVQAGMQNQLLTMEDVLYLNNIDDLKDAQIHFAKIAKLKRKQMAQAQAQANQAQQEAAMQQAQMAHQMEVQLKKIEGQLDIQEQALKEENENLRQERDHLFRKELEAMRNKMKEFSTLQNNSTKLVTKSMDKAQKSLQEK